MRLFEKTITEQENGWTAEQVLRRSLGLSTTRIKRAKFRPDGILLDGVRINTAQRVRLGQHLEPVSYTHLDVYKRQRAFRQLTATITNIRWLIFDRTDIFYKIRTM